MLLQRVETIIVCLIYVHGDEYTIKEWKIVCLKHGDKYTFKESKLKHGDKFTFKECSSRPRLVVNLRLHWGQWKRCSVARWRVKSASERMVRLH